VARAKTGTCDNCRAITVVQRVEVKNFIMGGTVSWGKFPLCTDCAKMKRTKYLQQKEKWSQSHGQ
jgi:hypothetical protein